MKKFRNAEYYFSLLDRMGENVFNTRDLYELIGSHNESHGGKRNPATYSLQLSDLLEIAGKKHFTIVEGSDGKRGTYSKLAYLYQLTDVKGAKDSIRKHFAEKKTEEVHETVQTSIRIFDAQAQSKREKTNDVKSRYRQEVLERDRLEAKQEQGVLISGEESCMIKYAVAGLIMLSKTAEIDIEDALIYLKKDFGLRTAIKRKEVLNVLSVDPRFVLPTQICDNLVRLSDPRKDWESIKEQCNPDQFNKTILVRLGMSLNELKGYFKEGTKITTISEISATESIYKIIVNCSFCSKMGLAKLVRSFRGSDTVLSCSDEKFIDSISIMIQRIDAVFGVVSSANQIEHLIVDPE